MAAVVVFEGLVIVALISFLFCNEGESKKPPPPRGRLMVEDLSQPAMEIETD
jgi:hypothetical protein